MSHGSRGKDRIAGQLGQAAYRQGLLTVAPCANHHDTDSKRHQQNKKAALVSKMFLVHFYTVGGSGDTLSLFGYD